MSPISGLCLSNICTEKRERPYKIEQGYDTCLYDPVVDWLISYNWGHSSSHTWAGSVSHVITGDIIHELETDILSEKS